jgi:hypothetical protein
MVLWQVTPEYIVHHLRWIRPITLETPEQEQQLVNFHRCIAVGQRHFYADADVSDRSHMDLHFSNTTATPADQLALV